MNKINTSKVKVITKRITKRSMAKFASNAIDANKATKKESTADNTKVVDNKKNEQKQAGGKGQERQQRVQG